MSGMEFEQEVDTSEFVGLLRQCADALERDENMSMTLEGQTISFHPRGRMKVSYEQEKGKKSELEFEIKWQEAA